MSKGFAATIFKYRSYTPIPFLLVMLFYAVPNIWSLLTGFTIACAGELIRLWGVSWAGSETRTTGTVGGTFLIISGPFAYVRNPLYVGNILLYVGMGVMSFALFPFLPLLALMYFLFQYHIIVLEEEKYLKQQFGKDYEDYFNAVPRFFFRFSAYKNPAIPQPEFNLKAGLRSERRTFQAFAFVSFTILLLYIVRKFS